MSRKRTIGPAMSCGNRHTYMPNEMILCCAFVSPRYTSIVYDIVWNV